MSELLLTATDQKLLRVAYEQAVVSYRQEGVPVGAVLADGNEILSSGHNQRVQNQDPTAHGEIDCLRNGKRRVRYDGLTLYTTLSPCMMCAGAIIQFGISRVVVGENRNFAGNVDFLRSHGVEVVVVDDADCIDLMANFIHERPDLWDEDISGRTYV